MKWLFLNIIVLISSIFSFGNTGRYELELITNSGEEIHGYLLIASYDNLRSDFEKGEDCMDYLFEIYGINHLHKAYGM